MRTVRQLRTSPELPTALTEPELPDGDEAVRRRGRVEGRVRE
ncbi:hypothetical protein ACFPZI_06115 [Streptomyces chlorus]|uniref:Uncharacterized protein n=1 Tax=Streptomyces chlorus TaxID=887452 RepID=A0ABW1DU92_9ACTN